MPRTMFAVPVIITLLVAGFLLTSSNPGFSQPVSAAPNQQPIFDIHTEMVPNNWPMIPSGLGPGDSFRLLHVTVNTTDGTTNNINRYNDFVRNEVRQNPEFKGNMTVLFKALVSVYQGIDARGNTRTRQGDHGANSPIYWVRGDKVADSYADFYDGSWDSRVARTASGLPLTNQHLPVHTGSTHQGTHAKGTEGGNLGWDLGLGSPPAWWAWGVRKSAYGEIGASTHPNPGHEIYAGYRNSSDVAVFYGISPLFKVRDTTGPNPVISGPTGTVRDPFDVTITFPDDYLVLGMRQNDIRISGGKLSNFRHTAGAGTATGDRADETGTVYTVTVTPNAYATSIYDATTVSISVNAGAATDTNGWESVASNTYSVKASRLKHVAVPISLRQQRRGHRAPDLGADTQRRTFSPATAFRLLFVTGSTRDTWSGKIEDYNSFVQNAAGLNSLLSGFKGRFRVVGSTGSVHAIDNSGTRGTGVPIYWLSGVKAADNYTDFYDGSWDSRAGTNELGSPLSTEGDAVTILTGTANDGTAHGDGRSSTGFGTSARVSATSLGRAAPFNAFITTAGTKGSFYALSPVLKVAEPGGL